mgnify:CR=1 FL=1
MTSRERVREVLNHRIPDRVPNGLGGCETVGLHLLAYDRLQRMLGVEAKPPRLDTFMTNAVFEEPVIRAMDGDIILLASPNMCGSQLRGDVADQWKEQKLWGKTFSVSLREHFRENSDGSTTWVSRGMLSARLEPSISTIRVQRICWRISMCRIRMPITPGIPSAMRCCGIWKNRPSGCMRKRICLSAWVKV